MSSSIENGGREPGLSGTSGSDPSYESKLAAWKARMGVPENSTGEPDADALMIAEDAKRPGKDYCQGCADEFPISEMRLITRAIDPYRQFESDEEEPFSEENRVRMCKACFAREYESDDDDELCSDCPPIGYPTDKTRCAECPRRDQNT